MNDGGALLVQRNDLHGAEICGQGVEAYAWPPAMCAASTEELSDQTADASFQWRQFIASISRTGLPSAVQSAWVLRWNCICQDFQDIVTHLSPECSGASSPDQAVYDDYLSIDFKSQFKEAIAHENNVCSVAALSARQSHVLHSNIPSNCPKPIYGNPNSIPLSTRKLPSCLGKSRTPCSRSNTVQFDQNVLLHIGLDDEIEMAAVNLHHDALQGWQEKPWTRKPKRIANKRGKRRQVRCSHTLSAQVDDPTNAFDPYRNHDSQHHDSDMISSLEQTGLVTHYSDENALMQTPKQFVVSFKNEPIDRSNIDFVHAFHEGYVYQGEGGSDSQPDSPQHSEGYSPSEGPESPDAGPPTDENDRQDVMLYHLQDHPIRALISWSNYEDMMTEIAHHFALVRNALVDAYEVVVSPPDLEPEVTPIIVHVINDFPLHLGGRLVLLDIEYHGHRIETHFQSGPIISRQVLPISRHVNRNELLACAKIERYCRAENGRCLVFINSRRWPDYDVDRKTIAHGDYIKISVPPSERFACSTEQIAEMTQRGFTDQQILDEMVNDEAVSDVSPEMLNDDEVRLLATSTPIDGDVAHLMQFTSSSNSDQPVSRSSNSRESSESIIPLDWFIDLQRIVSPLEQCGADIDQEVLFSVYTWMVDHQDEKICKEPKIVVLGGDPSEWEDDVRQPWQHLLTPQEHVFIDIAAPTARRSHLEEHVAHLILTRRHSSRSSVLISIEFVDDDAPSVIVRFAAVLPTECTLAEVISTIPLLTAFSLNPVEWIAPRMQDNHQSFHTWSGMGLIVKIFPHTEGISIEEDADEQSLVQLHIDGGTDAFPEGRDSMSKSLVQSVFFCGNELHSKTLPFQRRIDDPYGGTFQFSLTEEFIRYVQAVGSQIEGNGPIIQMPDGLQDQPIWIQDLWEKWTETLAETGGNLDDGLRVETWFSNPRRWSRCANSRLVVLSRHFHHWERELLAAWPEKADLALPTQFAIVFPTPEDADRNAQEQLIIEQQSEPFSRSVVATLYDTNWDQGRPSSIALVVADRLDVRSFITMMGYSEICSPEYEQNECLMWMGNIAIHQDQVINVRLGNAFKLLVRRGIRVSVQELLSMPDHRLRSELQSAIGGCIFRRPNTQGFPSDANALNNPVSHQSVSQQSSDDYPPEWLNALQECFDRYAVEQVADEGRAIYVLVWFLNGGSFLRNESPRVVRLDADNRWWRTELLFPWRDQFARGYQADLHFVDPIPVSEPWQSHSAHVIVTQALPSEHVPVVVSVVERGTQADTSSHVALVVNQFSSAQNIADRFELIRSRHVAYTVTRGRNVFPEDLTVRLGPGDGLVLRVMSDSERPRHSDSVAEQISHSVQVDNSNLHEENPAPHDGEDLEDAFLMQAFQNVHAPHMSNADSEVSQHGTICALGFPEERHEEADAFQFNPAAPAFMPSAVVLPAWAQVIEDIYHDWDVHAFAWQGEARATHFMTWYLAPGINRIQCLYGRKIALYADFWNWREQFRAKWIDEIDPGADLEVVYVSPPPTQLEAGVVGHIILLQHNSAELSSVLLSVYDPAINARYPFKTAHAFAEQLQLQDVLTRIGYATECLNLAQCHFRLRGQTFVANQYIRATDGDAIDLLVQRVAVPVNWNPPIVPHAPGAEGLALFQKRCKIVRTQRSEDEGLAGKNSVLKATVSLVDSIGPQNEDIVSIPFTLAAIFQQSAAQAQDLVISVWEMHESVDVEMCPKSCFEKDRSRGEFCKKHSLIKQCSDLYPVKFTRTHWNIGEDRWHVGSFRAPDPHSAVVACVEYASSGAVATAHTVPRLCKTDFLRSMLHIRFGTLIRLNGQFVGEDAQFEHGDLLEYHVGHQHTSAIDRRCGKVQICLDAVIERVLPRFDYDADATEVLPFPSVRHELSNEDAWTFHMIPEGTPLHRDTYEALHCQSRSRNLPTQKYELYIDGATSNGLSAWAVVAVCVSGDERSLLGCVAGLTEINQSSPRWIGAENHTNIDAELSAMAVATAFAYFAAGEVHVTVRPDLALSQQFLNMQSTTRQSSTLAKVIHVLGQAKPSNVDVQEVRAHRGDPWNELADAIAKHVAVTGIDVGSTPWRLLNQIATSPSTIKWEWLRHEPPSFCQAMPTLHGNAVWQPLPSVKQIQVKVTGPDPQSHRVGFSFRMATYNGLALNDDGEQSPCPNGRVPRIDIQFHHAKLALIGIQEARTPAGCRVSENYRIFSSGYQSCGKAKHFGCELWIHKSLPFCTLPDGRKIGLRDCKVTIVEKDARLLIAHLEGPIDIMIVVAHAPCVSAGRPISQVSQWWHSLTRRLSVVPKGNMVVLIDANAPLADSETKFFGRHQAEHMNPQGVEFQDFLVANEFYAPATFAGHSGIGATWRHPRGDKLRRDYVLLGHSLFSVCTQSAVLSDFDGGFSHADHCPAMCVLDGFMTIGDEGRQLKWDFNKIQDIDARKAFMQSLETLPIPTWSVSVDDHSSILETNLLQLAQQHFGRRKNEKPRALRQATLNGIQLKRQMLDMMRKQDFDDPLLHDEMKTIESIVRPMILHDQKQWYADWLDGINEAGAQHDTAMVYKKLQRLGRRKKSLEKGPRPLPRLRVVDDKFAQTFEECQETWKRQFALTEAGVPVTDAQLVQLHQQPVAPCLRDAKHCPDPCEVLSIIRKCKNGKVPGPGQLPVDILKAGGAPMAKLLTPLLVKASWHMREPLKWKGGLLIPLFKGKGSPAEPSAYRSIFLSDICAKIHHSHMRSALADVWSQEDDLIQMGGKKGCSTDVAHHFLHAHLSWSRAQNVSCGILFVDLQAAFYSILRSSLFPGEFHDDEICFAMKQLGITPKDWQDIKSCITQDNATDGVEAHSAGILRDMFSGTHFMMHGLSDKIATMRGTRPGDPVADILFNMAFRLVVLDARRKIQMATGVPWFGSPKSADDITSGVPIPVRGFAEITFVDDIAYAIHSSNAEDLVSSLQITASCLHDAASDRGLGINYQAGKTEAILKLAGTKAKSVKHKVWHECGGFLPVVTEHGTQQLRLVHSYKHLGSYVQDHAVVQKDVRHRISQARKAYGQLSRQFYNKKNVSDHTKSSVFSALVMSRLSYNVHTWSWVTDADIECWENGIKAQVAALAKHKFRPIPSFQFSTAELCALAGIFSPADVLHANRLRYVRRAIHTAPTALWGLLHDNPHSNSWLPRLLESYQWLRQHLRPGLLPTCRDANELLQVIAINQRWYGHVKTALKSSLQYYQAKAQGKVWTSRLQYQIARFATVSVPEVSRAEKRWKCNLCNDTFDTKKALSVHARHKHQYRTVLKYYVLGDECLACGKKFFDRVRLLAHVGNAQKCKDTYYACFVPATEETVEQIEAEERDRARDLKSQGWHASKAFLPMTRAQGPLLPERGTDGAIAMRAKWQNRVLDVGRAFEGLDGFCEQSSGDLSDETEFIPFLLQTNGGRSQGEAGIFQQFGLAAETARLHIKGFLFVHFFSGFRRPGDLQDCIESHDVVGTDHIFCLSIDLCLAKEHSDLTDDHTKQFWIEKMKSGQVIGIGGGPSCETWSAARHADNGPPPVRSFDCPWGMPGLSAKQWMQVLTGTKLIQFLIDLALAAQLGLCGFLEHPQYPVWLMRQKPASIWTLTALRMLARLECFQICSFDQCVYGLNATKPTTLMLLRMSTFKDITFTRGLRGRCPHHSGHRPLQGIQSDGTFATARAKIYPAAMNQAIAIAVSRFLTDRQLKSDWRMLPEDLQKLTCTEFVDEDVVQPDFHRLHCR